MLNLFQVSLECHNETRNAHRQYSVAAGTDLFGTWVVTVRNGRVGTDGAIRTYAAGTVEMAGKMVALHLRRRLSAPRRVGASYRVIRLDSVPELDVTAWLPDEFRSEADRVGDARGAVELLGADRAREQLGSGEVGADEIRA